jgi:hypothetical protein
LAWCADDDREENGSSYVLRSHRLFVAPA